MTSLDTIRYKIQELYKNSPNVHVNVTISNPKIYLKNEPVIITGAYSHIFQIEEKSDGFPKRHTLQYTDILLRHVEILELNEN